MIFPFEEEKDKGQANSSHSSSLENLQPTPPLSTSTKVPPPLSSPQGTHQNKALSSSPLPNPNVNVSASLPQGCVCASSSNDSEDTSCRIVKQSQKCHTDSSSSSASTSMNEVQGQSFFGEKGRRNSLSICSVRHPNSNSRSTRLLKPVGFV